MGRYIGIDFGTTNTVVTFRNPKGKIKKIYDKSGDSSIRTALFFISKTEYLIGREAFLRGREFPRACCVGFKPRVMGEKYEIVAEDGSTFYLSPAKAVRLFLNKVLKEYLEKMLAKNFGSPELTQEDMVVVTVPVKFNPEEKKTIKQAALKANYPNLKIAFEPTAAAIASAEEVDGRQISDDDCIAVYDMGGGTFDISIIARRSNGSYFPLEKGQDGDKTLGGDCVTRQVITNLLREKLESNGFYFSEHTDEEDFECDPDEFGVENETEYFRNWHFIKDLAEEIKMVFSDPEYTEETFTNTSLTRYGESVPFSITLKREQYHACIRELIGRTVAITDRVIKATEEANHVQVNKLILAGGSSQILLIREMLEEQFADKELTIYSSRKPFELISIGALLLSEKGSDFSTEEKTISQFGVAEKSGMAVLFTPLIKEDMRLPVTGKRMFQLSQENYKSGEINVRFYEKDVSAYPNARVIGKDNGLTMIEQYSIRLDPDDRPTSAEVSFIIEKDGTIRLVAVLMDAHGNPIKNVEACAGSERDLE